MNLDEFSFFNQQLAGMLKDGIPLEGALKRLCASMRDRRTKSEMEILGKDLALGVPLDEALGRRKLPEFYKRMLKIGAKGNNLPGMLLMLADYYQRVNVLWLKLRGLMVYPMIVLVACLALSIFLTLTFVPFVGALCRDLGMSVSEEVHVLQWGPLLAMGCMLLALLGAWSLPRVRDRLRWRISAYRDAGLSQIAAAIALMLRGGASLEQALVAMIELEGNTQAGKELTRWLEDHAAGNGKFPSLSRPGRVFPPLFLWLLDSAGEDIVSGFERAAEIFQSRAVHRTEVFLHCTLPVMIIWLGFLILCQVYSSMIVFIRIIQTLGQD